MRISFYHSYLLLSALGRLQWHGVRHWRSLEGRFIIAMEEARTIYVLGEVVPCTREVRGVLSGRPFGFRSGKFLSIPPQYPLKSKRLKTPTFLEYCASRYVPLKIYIPSLPEFSYTGLYYKIYYNTNIAYVI